MAGLPTVASPVIVTLMICSWVPLVVPIAPTQEELLSCRGKCGQGQLLPCSCDQKCIIFNSCCEDMAAECPQIIEEAEGKFDLRLQSQIECSPDGIFVIKGCLEEDTHEQKAFGVKEPNSTKTVASSPVSSPFDSTLVTDASSGFVYKNFSIFACYATDVSQPVFWDISVQPLSFDSPKNVQQILSIINEQSSLYVPPAGMNQNLKGHYCRPDSIRECKEDLMVANPNILDKCKDGPASYVRARMLGVDTSYIYHNKNCLECNLGANVTLEALQKPFQRKSGNSLSMLVSLSKANLQVRLGPDNTLALAVLPWRVITCSFSQGSQKEQEENCQTQICGKDYELRPDNVCRILHKERFAVASDGYTVTSNDLQILPQFVACQFGHSFDAEVNTANLTVTTVYDIRLNLVLYVIEMLIYFPSTNSPASPKKFANLSAIAKAFKEYRRRRGLLFSICNNESNGDVSNNENNIKSATAIDVDKADMGENNEDRLPVLESYEPNAFVRGTDNRGAELNVTKTTVCYCNSLLSYDDKCKMWCWQDSTYETDIERISYLMSLTCHFQNDITDQDAGTKSGANRHCCLRTFGMILLLFLPVIEIIAFTRD